MNEQLVPRSADPNKQPMGKRHDAWCLFQWGTPWGTYRTRKEAIAEATASYGSPWKKTRSIFRVQRVKVIPYE